MILATSIGISAIAMTNAWTPLFSPITSAITGSYCTSIHVEIIAMDQTSQGTQVDIQRNFIRVDDKDLDEVPKLRDVMSEAAKAGESPQGKFVGVSEDQWNQIREWISQKYLEQYNKPGSTSYIHYDGKNYNIGFAIC